jgi:alanyl-tRNA synthetase
VENTSELGGFKILKEQSSSAGVRRIKAVVSNLS